MYLHPPSPIPRPIFRWLLTDIDGTLLDDAGNMPEQNRLALLHCRERGVPVAFATGRRWTTLQKLIERLRLEDLCDFAIVNNGMVVKDLRRRTAIHRENFSMPEAMQAVTALENLNLDPIALTYNPTGEVDVYHRRLSLMNGDFVAKNSRHSRRLDAYQELEDLSLVEFILLGPEPELREAELALAGLPLETALIRNTFYSGFMLEITPAGISKLSGAGHVARTLGFTLAEAVAIGDSANDLSLLRQAGRAVAVANASAQVREAAHEIVATGENAGVAEAIFRHFPVV